MVASAHTICTDKEKYISNPRPEQLNINSPSNSETGQQPSFGKIPWFSNIFLPVADVGYTAFLKVFLI